MNLSVLIMAILSVYHPRDSKVSHLWQIFNRHYDDFEKSYAEKFEKKFGFFRPVIGEVVRFHVDETLMESGRIDTTALSPVGRLAGAEFTTLGRRFSLDRKK